MTIKKTIQKQEVLEIELETPCYFKIAKEYSTGPCLYRVLSEDDITEVQLCGKFNCINRMPLRFYHTPEKIFESESITEQEFNQALAEAKELVSGMPVPLMEAV